jgi:5'-3' exonuclease, N-terminal resolvase-like domain/T4 RNase H, C terminal
LNQVIFSAIALDHFKDDITEDVIRHVVLNCLRSYRSNFKHKYGELVLCSDSRKYWRKEVFPFYKSQRKKAREASGLDWPTIFAAMDKIKSELSETFPYKFIEVEGAEADDIIATMVSRVTEPILILSSDKDFIQLHRPGVEQYDPAKKRFITHPNPLEFLREHIIRGDFGDGIPNIKCNDNVISLGIKQAPITKNFVSEITEFLNSELKGTKYERNYLRNAQLIDLSNIPESIKLNIWTNYNNQPEKGRAKLFNYFVAHRLKNLIISLNEF